MKLADVKLLKANLVMLGGHGPVNENAGTWRVPIKAGEQTHATRFSLHIAGPYTDARVRQKRGDGTYVCYLEVTGDPYMDYLEYNRETLTKLTDVLQRVAEISGGSHD